MEKLYEIQQQEDFKAAHRLSESCLRPRQYQKMRVPFAYNLMSNDVSAGLQINQKKIGSSVETTAFFCRQVFKWFKLCTSRTISLALSHKNMNEYKEAIEFLKDFIFIIKELDFGSKALKPYQKGVLMSTTSLLELQEYLIQEGFDFVFSHRFTQDCVENLFSQIRASTRKPTALQFKQTLKRLLVSNFITQIEGSNYEMDDNEDYKFSMIDFLDDKRQLANTSIDSENEDLSKFEKFKITTRKLDFVLLNHLYYQNSTSAKIAPPIFIVLQKARNLLTVN